MKSYFLKDYPELEHFFLLEGRQSGASSKLRGTVALVSVYAHYYTHSWPEEHKRDFEQHLNRAAEWLESEAKRYGVFLRVKPHVHDIPSPVCRAPSQGLALLSRHFGTSSIGRLQKHFEDLLQVNEAPIQLAHDVYGRSFATMQLGAPGSDLPEISHIFYYHNRDTWQAIAHELLHQFGAIDYYFPEQLTKSATRHFGNSIMGIGAPAVDDLTAYLIGWKDTINEETLHFLQECSYLTREIYEKERKKS